MLFSNKSCFDVDFRVHNRWRAKTSKSVFMLSSKVFFACNNWINGCFWEEGWCRKRSIIRFYEQNTLPFRFYQQCILLETATLNLTESTTTHTHICTPNHTHTHTHAPTNMNIWFLIILEHTVFILGTFKWVSPSMRNGSWIKLPQVHLSSIKK